jgi:hypothetical protein
MRWVLLAHRQGQSVPKNVGVCGFCNIFVNLKQQCKLFSLNWTDCFYTESHCWAFQVVFHRNI